jgi:hypothetical protein
MASTTVTVFPVPGGPYIKYGGAPFLLKISDTAFFCSALIALFTGTIFLAGSVLILTGVVGNKKESSKAFAAWIPWWALLIFTRPNENRMS